VRKLSTCRTPCPPPTETTCLRVWRGGGRAFSVLQRKTCIGDGRRREEGGRGKRIFIDSREEFREGGGRVEDEGTGLGFRVKGSGLRVENSGFRVEG